MYIWAPCYSTSVSTTSITNSTCVFSHANSSPKKDSSCLCSTLHFPDSATCAWKPNLVFFCRIFLGNHTSKDKRYHDRSRSKIGLLPIATILLRMMEEILPMWGAGQDLVWDPKKLPGFWRCWKVKRVSADWSGKYQELLGEIKQWSQCCFGLMFWDCL